MSRRGARRAEDRDVDLAGVVDELGRGREGGGGQARGVREGLGHAVSDGRLQWIRLSLIHI